jgi:predicted small secreted protein
LNQLTFLKNYFRNNLNLKGSWVELNNKRQQVNNMTLIVGTLVLLSGLVGVIYLNINILLFEKNLFFLILF